MKGQFDGFAVGFPDDDDILDVIWRGHRQGVDGLLYQRRTHWHRRRERREKLVTLSCHVGDVRHSVSVAR